jgi:hypothetical protein
MTVTSTERWLARDITGDLERPARGPGGGGKHHSRRRRAAMHQGKRQAATTAPDSAAPVSVRAVGSR